MYILFWPISLTNFPKVCVFIVLKRAVGLVWETNLKIWVQGGFRLYSIQNLGSIYHFLIIFININRIRGLRLGSVGKEGDVYN